RVSALPDVGQAVTLRSFVPDDQQQKLAVISDAQNILDPTLTPIETKAPPTNSETLDSIARTEQALRRVAARSKGAGVEDANRLAATVAKLEIEEPQVLEFAEKAVVAPLLTTVTRAGAALTACPAAIDLLPAALRN